MRREGNKSLLGRDFFVGQAAVSVLSILISLIMISSCSIPRRTAGRQVEQYSLEYSPYLFKGYLPLDTAIRVSRFTVAWAYHGSSMVYRSGPYKRDVYRYHRWRTNPGDMVSDYLLRDFRATSLFKGVFSYREGENPRFVLEGEVMEFLELSEEGGRKGSLVVGITLLDMNQVGVPEQIVLQETFRAREPIEVDSPSGLAASMSRAMKKISSQMIGRVYGIVKDRL